MSNDVMFLVFLSFLSGSVPFGYIVGIIKGEDVRVVGSGKIGATNVARTVGKKYGFIVLLLDALKGFLPVYLSAFFGFSSDVQVMSAVSAVAGHCFSPFMFFKGGKGVATSLGAFIPISFYSVGIVFVVFLVVFGFTGYVSAASVVSAALFPFIFYLFGCRDLMCVSLVVFVAFVVIFKHRENIRRIIRGEERKFR